MAKVLRIGIALLALLGGCSSILSSGRSGAPPSVQPAAEQSGLGDAGRDAISVYLQTLGELVEGDAVVKADAFRKAADAAAAQPTTTNRLNLALALATPGHPSSNPAEAQKQLSGLLASGDALLPEERTLALIHLKDVEQRLILDAEAQRVQRAAQTASAQRNDQTAQRLQAALEENRQLKTELDEAKAKLDAIANIERSIRERENGPNPQ
jgi:hypothetical protein